MLMKILAILLKSRDISSLLESDKLNSNRYIGFFPFEIQIIDQDTYQQNQLGSANHDRYKQSQIRSARRRALGAVLTFDKNGIKKTKR